MYSSYKFLVEVLALFTWVLRSVYHAPKSKTCRSKTKHATCVAKNACKMHRNHAYDHSVAKPQHISVNLTLGNNLK